MHQSLKKGSDARCDALAIRQGQRLPAHAGHRHCGAGPACVPVQTLCVWLCVRHWALCKRKDKHKANGLPHHTVPHPPPPSFPFTPTHPTPTHIHTHPHRRNVVVCLHPHHHQLRVSQGADRRPAKRGNARAGKSLLPPFSFFPTFHLTLPHLSPPRASSPRA